MMAKATYVRVKEYIEDNYLSSTAIVDVDGVEVEVLFNYLLISQWGKEGTKQYIIAEALWATQNYQDAIDVLSVDATGSIVKNKDGSLTDTRSWQQNWIDNHPVPARPLTLDVDPLL